jgi:hypothetical protein
MQPIFDPMELDLSTPDEREFWDHYVKDLIGYQKGKVDGVKIKAQTAAAAACVKKQQSRSAMAMIKYDMQKRGMQVGGAIRKLGKE